MKTCISSGLDYELVEKLKHGDEHAYLKIYDYFFPRLNSFAYTYLKDKAEVEEIIQDTFLKIWECRSEINSCLTFNNFLYKIVKNKILDCLRKKVTRQKFTSHFLKVTNDFDNSTVEMLEFNEFEKIIEEMIAKMPPQRQLIFKLSRNEGLSHKKIAEKLNLSVKTVENQIGQAISFIRQNLANDSSYYLLIFLLFYL